MQDSSGASVIEIGCKKKLMGGRRVPCRREAMIIERGARLQQPTMAIIPVRNAEGILFGHRVEAANNFFRRRGQYSGLFFFYLLRSGVPNNFGGWQGGQWRTDDNGGGDYLDDIGLHR